MQEAMTMTSPRTTHPAPKTAQNQSKSKGKEKSKQKPNAGNPITFRRPYDSGFLIPKNTEKSLVMVGYEGVIRDTFKALCRFQLVCKDNTYQKQDLLMIAKASEFNEVVKPLCLWRPEVKKLELKSEQGLTKKLDTAKYLKPYIGFVKDNGKYRKPKSVKVVLRNGLVVSCRMLGQDNWNMVAECEYKSRSALILIFKHAIHSVEKASE